MTEREMREAIVARLVESFDAKVGGRFLAETDLMVRRYADLYMGGPRDYQRARDELVDEMLERLG